MTEPCTWRYLFPVLTTSDGVDLHVEDRGQGQPALLLIHGFAGSARNFLPQSRALGAKHRVLTFDVRGHARSGAPHEPNAYDPDRHVADILEVLDHAGEARAVVGGLSMGAGLALRFALAHPERVSGLLLAAFPRTGHEAKDWAYGFAMAIEERGLDVAGGEYVWGRGSRFSAKDAEVIKRGLLEHQPHALAHLLRRLLAEQPSLIRLKEQLKALTMPVTVIVGSEDQPALRPTEQLRELLPSAEIIVFQGAGHVVNLERTSDFNDALLRLMSRTIHTSAS